jgi:hypothetical protein
MKVELTRLQADLIEAWANEKIGGVAGNETTSVGQMHQYIRLINRMQSIADKMAAVPEDGGFD